MASNARISWIRIAQQALIAGIAGGVLIDAYLWATTIAPVHGSILTMWQWIASTAVGKVAFTDPAYATVGLAMHGLVSVCWAAGYAYLAATRPFVNRRWLVSGLVYGIVVYAIMQLILLAGNNFAPPPNPGVVYNAIVAHAVFFGIPVAFLVSILQPRNAA
jgi:uncharacterized membrane protein YagU involved in acid resistance